MLKINVSVTWRHAYLCFVVIGAAKIEKTRTLIAQPSLGQKNETRLKTNFKHSSLWIYKRKVD